MITAGLTAAFTVLALRGVYEIHIFLHKQRENERNPILHFKIMYRRLFHSYIQRLLFLPKRHHKTILFPTQVSPILN